MSPSYILYEYDDYYRVIDVFDEISERSDRNKPRQVLKNKKNNAMVAASVTKGLYKLRPGAEYAPDWLELRLRGVDEGGYGYYGQQLEILGEQGEKALKDHIAAVKARHPKPKA